MAPVLKVIVYSCAFSIVSLNVYYFYSDPKLHGRLEYKDLAIRDNPGRLGNQMFLLATLYGIAKLNGRNIKLMPHNLEALAAYFDINFPQVDLDNFRPHNPWKIGYWLSPADLYVPATSNILTGNMYPTSSSFFDHVQDEIRSIFRFKPKFQEHADNVLRHVKKLRPQVQTFVGVHVRRGDYLRKGPGGWLRAADGREVDLPFFQKAVQYFRKKYQHPVFLAVSDDRNWTRESLSPLGILTLPDVDDPGNDLALLANCNHTIMTYGSFGFWGGYLARGEVIYFSDFLKPSGNMSKIFVYRKMYPRHWIGLDTTPEGFWKNYTNPFVEK